MKEILFANCFCSQTKNCKVQYVLIINKNFEHNWQFVIQRLLSIWKGINVEVVAKFAKRIVELENFRQTLR